jgi:hypothetical protein
MGVAVTLCTQPDYERRENENHYSFFRGSEKESLPNLGEFGTPASFQILSLISFVAVADASKTRRARHSRPAIIGPAASRCRFRAVV